MEGELERRSWHVDKGIPLALLITIAIQTGAMIWWASGLDARVNQLEKQTLANAWQSERIVRIDERLNALQDGLGEVKTILRDQGRTK